MNKELEFIRKAVISACHPTCESYEEAIENELYNGCILRSKTHPVLLYKIVAWRLGDKKYLIKEDSNCLIIDCDRENLNANYTIIGQPATLARVLILFNKNYDKDNNEGEYSIYTADEKYLYFGDSPMTTLFHKWKDDPTLRWDLTKDLDDQELETIISIAKLLGYTK